MPRFLAPTIAVAAAVTIVGLTAPCGAGSAKPRIAAAAPADPAAGPPARADSDSVARSARVVRVFDALIVRGQLGDPRSSETVHVVTGEMLRALPVDGLASAVALQAG